MRSKVCCPKSQETFALKGMFPNIPGNIFVAQNHNHKF